MTRHSPARSWQLLSAAWLFIALSLVGGLIFDVHKYPLLISEGGIIESLSALGYFISVAAMFYYGGVRFAKRYHYLIMLTALFGLRELDFDKRFTSMGILKGRFFTSDLVPLEEKFIGAVVVLVLIYIVFRIVKDQDLATAGNALSILQYNEYVDKFIDQEDEIVTTTLAEELDASETEIDLTSSTGFDSAGTIFIENEQITYTGISTNTLTGCTRGANSTTAKQLIAMAHR